MRSLNCIHQILSDDVFIAKFGGIFDRESHSFIDKRPQFTGDLDPPFNYMDLISGSSKLVNFKPGVDDTGDVVSQVAFAGRWPEVISQEQFFGRSSGHSFVEIAREIRNESDTAGIGLGTGRRRPEFWNGVPTFPVRPDHCVWQEMHLRLQVGKRPPCQAIALPLSSCRSTARLSDGFLQPQQMYPPASRTHVQEEPQRRMSIS